MNNRILGATAWLLCAAVAAVYVTGWLTRAVEIFNQVGTLLGGN